MPTSDDELLRLLNDYGQCEFEWGKIADLAAFNHPSWGQRVFDRKKGARAAILAHISDNYARFVPDEGDGDAE